MKNYLKVALVTMVFLTTSNALMDGNPTNEDISCINTDVSATLPQMTTENLGLSGRTLEFAIMLYAKPHMFTQDDKTQVKGGMLNKAAQYLNTYRLLVDKVLADPNKIFDESKIDNIFKRSINAAKDSKYARMIWGWGRIKNFSQSTSGKNYKKTDTLDTFYTTAMEKNLSDEEGAIFFDDKVNGKTAAAIFCPTARDLMLLNPQSIIVDSNQSENFDPQNRPDAMIDITTGESGPFVNGIMSLYNKGVQEGSIELTKNNKNLVIHANNASKEVAAAILNNGEALIDVTYPWATNVIKLKSVTESGTENVEEKVIVVQADETIGLGEKANTEGKEEVK